jgi:hypothetical protein
VQFSGLVFSYNYFITHLNIHASREDPLVNYIPSGFREVIIDGVWIVEWIYTSNYSATADFHAS